uniref:Uncharacterized protein n=1 Tax=viral metagenome TaxID=1070528 RepID=A0A6M3L4Q3_9ZZZZ
METTWKGSSGKLYRTDWAGCTEVEVCEVCGRELCDCPGHTTAEPTCEPEKGIHSGYLVQGTGGWVCSRCGQVPHYIYQSVVPKVLDMGNYLVQDGQVIGWHPGE